MNMTIERYSGLQQGDFSWIAKGIGIYAAEVDGKGFFGHPGDDTGLVVAAAYVKYGAEFAAEVLRAFLHGYNTAKRAQGVSAVSEAELKRTAPFALGVAMRSKDIDEVVGNL